MPVLKGMRDTLAADLEVLGVPIHSSWPAELTLPCVFVTPPGLAGYIDKGPTFAEYTVAVDVVILVEHASAEVALAALEDLIELALVNCADWTLRGVDSPSPLSATDGGAEYLGTVIHLLKPTTLT